MFEFLLESCDYINEQIYISILKRTGGQIVYGTITVDVPVVDGFRC